MWNIIISGGQYCGCLHYFVVIWLINWKCGSCYWTQQNNLNVMVPFLCANVRQKASPRRKWWCRVMTARNKTFHPSKTNTYKIAVTKCSFICVKKNLVACNKRSICALAAKYFRKHKAICSGFCHYSSRLVCDLYSFPQKNSTSRCGVKEWQILITNLKVS